MDARYVAAGSPRFAEEPQVDGRPRSRLVCRVAFALATLAITTLALAARADAYIYWANSNGANTYGTIGRANLDGSDVHQSFVTRVTGTVAADGAHVYWTNFPVFISVEDGLAPGAIGRANPDGTGVDQSFITYPQNPYTDSPSDVAVGGAYVYWAITTTTRESVTAPPHYTGTIWRAHLDGSGAESFIPGTADSSISGVAVDGAHVYWANQGPTSDTRTIGRANLDGTAVNQSFITGTATPVGVAVDGAHVYWANLNGNTIGRADLDGTGVDQSFITGASDPTGVAVDGAHVYWANNVRTIGRANLDGTGVTQRFITGGAPGSVAVDALGPPPSNKFRISKAKVNKERGSAKLTVKVAGPGELELAKTKDVKGQRERAAQSGKLKLSIKPRGNAKKRLNKGGKAKVKAKVTFTPEGGTSDTKSKKIQLVKR